MSILTLVQKFVKLPYLENTFLGEKVKRITKKHGIEVIFIKGQTLKKNLSIPRGKNLEKQVVVYNLICKSKRCKMVYIEQTGRQIKSE